MDSVGGLDDLVDPRFGEPVGDIDALVDHDGNPTSLIVARETSVRVERRKWALLNCLDEHDESGRQPDKSFRRRPLG